MFKQILAVAAGAALNMAVWAAEPVLKNDHPDAYTVQRGDTLWEIAGKFLQKPWLWPQIWQANPQVANPHRIYPGDVLRLVWVDGQPRLTVDSAEPPPAGPRIRASPLADATPAVPLRAVQPFLEKLRVVDEAEYQAMPYVLAMEDGGLRGSVGQVVYVRGLQAAVGARVLLLRASNRYRELPESFWARQEAADADARELETALEFRNDAWYWTWSVNSLLSGRDELLGTELTEIGHGEVLRGGDPATVLLQAVDVEVRVEDRVIAGGALPFDLSFFPREPKSVAQGLRVVSLSGALNAAGPNDVIALPRGTLDGMENGQVYSIYRPAESVIDRVKYPDGSLTRAVLPGRSKVALPEEFVGRAMVFRTFDRVSYALVLDGIRPVKLGDHLRSPAD